MEKTVKQAAETFAEILNEMAVLFAQELLRNTESEKAFNEAQKKAFEFIRDLLAANLQISKLKAANMARIVVALAKGKLGQEVDTEYLKGAIENAF